MNRLIMVQRNIHYEAAFEDFLRSRGWPYVAVDERKKAIFAGNSIKSFDFLVYSSGGPNLLADVKGRKFPDCLPGKKRGSSRAWENWVTRDDLEGLTEWEKVFGSDFTAVFVFAYWLQGPPNRAPFEDVHFFRNKCYAFVGVNLSEYLIAAKPRSEKWQTLSAPTKQFIRMAKAIDEFL